MRRQPTALLTCLKAACLGAGSFISASLGAVLLMAAPVEGHPHYAWALLWTKAAAFALLYVCGKLAAPTLRAWRTALQLLDKKVEKKSKKTQKKFVN